MGKEADDGQDDGLELFLYPPREVRAAREFCDRFINDLTDDWTVHQPFASLSILEALFDEFDNRAVGEDIRFAAEQLCYRRMPPGGWDFGGTTCSERSRTSSAKASASES